jgi:hypothetical protein
MDMATVSTISRSSIDVHAGNSGTTQIFDSVILPKLDHVVRYIPVRFIPSTYSSTKIPVDLSQ